MLRIKCRRWQKMFWKKLMGLNCLFCHGNINSFPLVFLEDSFRQINTKLYSYVCKVRESTLEFLRCSLIFLIMAQRYILILKYYVSLQNTDFPATPEMIKSKLTGNKILVITYFETWGYFSVELSIINHSSFITIHNIQT